MLYEMKFWRYFDLQIVRNSFVLWNLFIGDEQLTTVAMHDLVYTYGSSIQCWPSLPELPFAKLSTGCTKNYHKKYLHDVMRVLTNKTVYT